MSKTRLIAATRTAVYTVDEVATTWVVRELVKFPSAIRGASYSANRVIALVKDGLWEMTHESLAWRLIYAGPLTGYDYALLPCDEFIVCGGEDGILTIGKQNNTIRKIPFQNKGSIVTMTRVPILKCFLVGTLKGRVLMVNDLLETQWEVVLNGAIRSLLVDKENAIYVGARNQVTKLNSSGRIQWTRVVEESKDELWSCQSLVTRGSEIVAGFTTIGSGSASPSGAKVGMVMGISSKSGEVLWSVKREGIGDSLSVVGDRVIAGSIDGSILAM